MMALLRCCFQLPEFSAAASALYDRLWRLSRVLLHALAAFITLDPAALLAPIDPEQPDQLPEGALTSTVLRVCHYHGGDGSGAGCARTVPPARSGVLFDEHTDSSLLTLSLLCPGCAGLQLRDAADGSWVDVEDADGASELDLEVHVGAVAQPLHNRHRTAPYPWHRCTWATSSRSSRAITTPRVPTACCAQKAGID